MGRGFFFPERPRWPSVSGSRLVASHMAPSLGPRCHKQVTPAQSDRGGVEELPRVGRRPGKGTSRAGKRTQAAGSPGHWHTAEAWWKPTPAGWGRICASAVQGTQRLLLCHEVNTHRCRVDRVADACIWWETGPLCQADIWSSAQLGDRAEDRGQVRVALAA